uniref:Tyrosinase copper-binding domain-containing protein n=1 Tax=Globisporangium ultimum (strain ATCC 200006 / CBS 805.95 / DAOM BR144) TaxID=431595 RepID=K3WTH8_GLOUD
MHYRFTEIHATKPTYDFAHGNCGFLLWHRKFLLAYENMLRAQGPSFKDVTLPYWNYFEDHDMNMFAGTSCNSIVTCSEFLADHGGSNSRYPYRSDVNITSTGRTRGFCVANGVTKSACASSFGSLSGACDGCIVRGDWSNEGVFFPISKLGISHSIEKIASGSEATTDPHDTLRKVLERGFHVDVHNTLNGTMSSTASPFDPVFFGHHGTIDLIQFVHNRCHYGTNEDNRRFDVFTQCSVKTRGAFVPITSDTKITMDYGDQPAEDDPVIGKFFAGIGSTYADFANPEELGNNSYRYAVDEYFEALFKSEDVVCPPGTFASDLRADRKHKHHRKHDQSDASNDDLERNPVYEIINTLAACGKELLERMPNLTQAEVAIQKSILECEATRQRSGREFEDYSPEFRETFNMPDDSHPPCYRLLQRVKSGAITMELSQSCRQEYGRLTDTKLMDGEFGKTFPSTTDSIDNGDEYDSESDSYDSTAGSEDRDSNADSKRPIDDGSTQVKSAHLRVAVRVRTSE